MTGGAALFLGAFALNLLRACPSIAPGDSPETVAACLVLGVTHPPGNPLLTLLGRLWLAIPAGNPAFRLNLLAGTLGAMLPFLLWRLADLLLTGRGTKSGRTAVSAVVALALTAFNPVLVHEAATAKGATYLLNAVFLAAAADALVRRRLAHAFILAGLMTVNHWMTAAALFPVVLVMVAVRRGSFPTRPAPLVAVFLVALTPWVAVPIRASAGPALNWGRADTIARFVAHVSRRPFLSAEMKPSPGSAARLATVGAGAVRGQLGFTGLLLAAGGFLAIAIRAPSFTLPLSLAAVFPFAAAVLYLDLPARLEHLMGAFLLPSVLAFSVAAVAGASAVSRIPRAWPAALLLVAAHAAFQYGGCRRANVARATWSYDLGRGLLAPLPGGAGLLLTSDLDTFPAWYHRIVEQRRPDVLVVNRVLLKHRWYRRSIGLDPSAAAPRGPIEALRSSRPAAWFAVPDPAFLPRHGTAFHLVVRLDDLLAGPAAPRAMTWRGTLECLGRLPDPRAALAVGYSRELLTNLGVR